MKPVLVDTGFLVAVYNRRERFHQSCLQIHLQLDRPLVTCEPVIAEALHLLRLTPGAADGLLESIEKQVVEISFEVRRSAAMVQKIMRKYNDVPADFADACLIAMADELDTGDILTLDSDFKHYRWKRTRSFNLLIPLE